jgi:hypothetical protein
VKEGENMPGATDRFDDFLRLAFGEGVSEPEYEADAAEAEAVPSELVSSILADARRESSKLLASRIVAAAHRVKWSAEDLAHEAPGQEQEARQFLATGGDPRQLSPSSLARLLWQARLKLPAWKELLGQAVASYVVFRRPVEGDVVWGRTTGLSGDQRADALSGAEVVRDPVHAKRVADEFVEEVVEEWTSLRKRAGGGQLRND